MRGVAASLPPLSGNVRVRLLWRGRTKCDLLAIMNPAGFFQPVCSLLITAALIASLSAQNGAGTRTWTAAEDHQNMMDQLGIKALRPGPSGNETAPNHANYDESLANPYPNLPDALTLENGHKVTSAEMWWKQRRPEIVADFDREVLGRVPRNVPNVAWRG